ncbi:MAG: AMP-binding protein, partial [Verrucomicrobia bacterium]|nr:AMP-binding protein [Verrucomicrobiota bacterium]
PLPGVELRVCDAEGTVLTPGDIGVLEVCGPNVFSGYWRMPEKTAEEMRPDGWFITGDVGRVDDDGYVHIVGRQKDLIISGGFNVYPKEVELVIDDCSGVEECAVIGAPHADFGEAVVAVVVAKAGEVPSVATILAEVAGRLAPFKRPKHIVIIDALPRNAMGKVQKAQLRSQFAEVFAATG